MKKAYLGDAVYAHIEREYIVLTTEDGHSTTNTIYLEPEVVTSLLDFIEEVVRERHA